MLHSDALAAGIAQNTKITNSQFRPISHIDAASLSQALESDALSLSQVALATCFEGIQGVHSNQHVWSKTKLYYSVFYATKALLMLRSISIFYIGRSPYRLEAQAGNVVIKKSGNSHTAVLKEFSLIFAQDALLSQQIGGISPLDWLVNQRNSASYKTAPICDPNPPAEFQRPSQKLRAHIQAYIRDAQMLYTFDPDHAMIAYPIAVLKRLNLEIKQRNPGAEVEISNHFVSILTRAACFIPEFKSELSAFDFK